MSQPSKNESSPQAAHTCFRQQTSFPPGGMAATPPHCTTLPRESPPEETYVQIVIGRNVTFQWDAVVLPSYYEVL